MAGLSPREHALRLAGTGVRTAVIAETVGVDRTTVGRWLRRGGLARKPSPPQTRVSDADLLAMRAAGWTHVEIGARVGMTKGGVEARLTTATARANPPRRPPSVRQLVQWRQQGASWADLARKSGQAPSTVRRRVLAAMRETMAPGTSAGGSLLGRLAQDDRIAPPST